MNAKPDSLVLDAVAAQALMPIWPGGGFCDTAFFWKRRRWLR